MSNFEQLMIAHVRHNKDHNLEGWMSLGEWMIYTAIKSILQPNIDGVQLDILYIYNSL